MRLNFLWPRGARTLDRGSLADLKALLKRVLLSGGPHGGPKSEILPGDRRLVITQWEGPDPRDRAWTYSYGEGYQARVRPIDGQHCLVLVSPQGSLVLEHFGLHINVAGAAPFYMGPGDADKADFGDSMRPFGVRIRGQVHRLIHAPHPGLVGFLETEVGDVYLCLLGIHDLALVLDTPGRNPRCLVRGELTTVNEWELLPEEAPTIIQTAPARLGPVSILQALGELAQLAPAVREHLITLAETAVNIPGAREVRRLLLALGVAHAKGQRQNLQGTGDQIYTYLVEERCLDSAPEERARRSALQWLVDHTPLVRQSFSQRRRLWTIHLEWFSKPTRECIEAMVACQARLQDPTEST